MEEEKEKMIRNIVISMRSIFIALFHRMWIILSLCIYICIWIGLIFIFIQSCWRLSTSCMTEKKRKKINNENDVTIFASTTYGVIQPCNSSEKRCAIQLKLFEFI